MKMAIINVILTTYILAYLVFVVNFTAMDKRGLSFIESFDKSATRGGIFFALMSGLTMLTAIAGNFSMPFA